MCRRRAEIKRVEHVQFLGFQPCGTPHTAGCNCSESFPEIRSCKFDLKQKGSTSPLFIPPRKKLELVKSWKIHVFSFSNRWPFGQSMGGLCRLRASGAYRLLGTTDKKLRAMLRGLPVIWTSCNQDAFMLQTLLGGWCIMVYCYIYIDVLKYPIFCVYALYDI